jgi:predicted PurR-regulated permease PerM
VNLILFLAVLTAPVLLGLVMLRQLGQTLQQMIQWSESFLQDKQLPILERCSSVQNEAESEALRYEDAFPASLQT